MSQGLINFQVPSSVKSGDVNVVVNGPGGASASFSFTVTAEAPAIYQYGNNHRGRGELGWHAQQRFRACRSGLRDHRLSDRAGCGEQSGDRRRCRAAFPQWSSATAIAAATIGPLSATVQFLGLAPEYAGVGQANIVVPALPTGDYPLIITVGGFVSASAVVSVSGSGTAYTSPLTLAGSVSFANSDPSSVVLYNNIAYVCSEDRIVMVDVTNAAAPAMIGEFGDTVLNGNGDRCVINTSVSPPYLVEIVGSTSGGTESFAVYSLGTPHSPSLLTVASNSFGHMVDLRFSGNYGFATTSYITYNNTNAQVISQTGDLLVFDFTSIPPARDYSPFFSLPLYQARATKTSSRPLTWSTRSTHMWPAAPQPARARPVPPYSTSSASPRPALPSPSAR